MNKKEKMYFNIYNHGKNLNNIFNTNYDNISLCKKLFRLEKKAHKLSTDYCNGDLNFDDWELLTNSILKEVFNILNVKNDYDSWISNIFVNGDCRGYALKIDDKYIRENNIKLHCDWGGYGIIAPDFN